MYLSRIYSRVLHPVTMANVCSTTRSYFRSLKIRSEFTPRTHTLTPTNPHRRSTQAHALVPRGQRNIVYVYACAPLSRRGRSMTDWPKYIHRMPGPFAPYRQRSCSPFSIVSPHWWYAPVLLCARFSFPFPSPQMS